MRFTDGQVAMVAFAAAREMQIMLCVPVPVPTWSSMDVLDRRRRIEKINLLRTGMTPQEMHETNVNESLSNGWKFGPRFDPDAKTSPALVPYLDVSLEERIVDALIFGIVQAMQEQE